MTDPTDLYDLFAEAHAEGWMVMLSSRTDGSWACHLTRNPDYKSASAPTPAQAITKALASEIYK
jgi:hypothetical protein